MFVLLFLFFSFNLILKKGMPASQLNSFFNGLPALNVSNISNIWNSDFNNSMNYNTNNTTNNTTIITPESTVNMTTPNITISATANTTNNITTNITNSNSNSNFGKIHTPTRTSTNPKLSAGGKTNPAKKRRPPVNYQNGRWDNRMKTTPSDKSFLSENINLYPKQNEQMQETTVDIVEYDDIQVDEEHIDDTDESISHMGEGHQTTDSDANDHYLHGAMDVIDSSDFPFNIAFAPPKYFSYQQRQEVQMPKRRLNVESLRNHVPVASL